MKRTVLHVFEEGEKTRFRDGEVELASIEGVSPGGVFEAAALGEGAVALAVFAAGFSCGFHNSPAPTWMFMMNGEMELEVSDGESRRIAAGDLVHFADASGQGHRSRVLGDQDVVVATAGFAP